MDDIQKLVLETISIDKQAIVFTPSRASAEKTAEDISKLTNFQFPQLEKEILKAASTPTKQCKRLSHCIRKGIAFHHAGLLQKQKDLIEEEFRKGAVRIICCTPTLAVGMSLPAFRVIIKSLKRYSGRWGMDWIPVLEYLQMAGRAGRPEFESYGEAISIANSDSDKEEIYERYICGQPEEIYSKLAVEPVLRTYLLSLISSGIIRDSNSMKEFFTKTFWAHQFKDMNKLELIMEKMLVLLEEWGFVTINCFDDVNIVDKNSDKNYVNNSGSSVDGANLIREDFVIAKELEEKKTNKKNKNEKRLRSTMLGKRISELYLDPLTARHLLDCMGKFNENKSVFSLLQMICHTLELRPLLRIKSKEQDFIQEELVKNYKLLLEEEPSVYDLEYDEFMNSIKTTLFFEEWINEKDEDFLLEKFSIRPGEIRVKIETADWLLYASEELAKLNDYKEAVKEIRKLRVRIKHGVKEELLTLLKLKGIGRIRARKLYSHGFKDIGEVKKADFTTLTQLLGRAIAESVKKQLGEEIKEVPKGKRKGQVSILKY
ncbi:MAG: helicase-related protein [Nanoarchaeota archaeon]|nr:hypothetical protein [Nanoarchaeota archaeon]MBU1632092.1 hypothetical protein [Nanoarchaeota archaeon]MBU1875726.1 hypothetical protein [Nanoarchaeota archaeon]